MMYVLALMLSVAAFADDMTFSKYQTSPGRNNLQEFRFKGHTVVFEKRSTLFDEKQDQRVGLMKPRKEGAIAKKLEGIMMEIHNVDQFLRTQNSSFDDLSPTPGHKTHYIFNGHHIGTASKVGKKLAEVYKSLMALDWKLDNGVEVVKGSVKTFKAGAVQSTTKFDRAACVKAGPRSVCDFPQFGYVYVE